MRPVHILFLLFLAVPLLEIYLLIEIGSVIGAIPTVFMVVFTAVLGAALLQAQGLSTMRRVQEATAQGELPAIEILEGFCLLIGGALLLTPGFFTDIIGFLCLVTPLRRALIKAWLRRRMRPPPGPGPGPRSGDSSRTIEGEYWRDDE
ncbi:FxsA family protein [Sulfuriflexus sp.]|uniref:FxsA family protein n=1 Tax=Sulfuriflexus sp. TaxID=2015443 RepID=UPI0028CD5044|nr:FxsA family protein [Sulfuriflexus sp.]MDT8404708.1 FxsA family protein [Sulfuriflexus sp.]